MRCRPSLSQSLSLSPTPQPASCPGSRSVVIDVWFNWGASTASGKDGTGLRLVHQIILALARTLLPSRLPQSLLLEICANLLPASCSVVTTPWHKWQQASCAAVAFFLLSLLLLCMKQLQHSCLRNPHMAFDKVQQGGRHGRCTNRTFCQVALLAPAV